MDQDTNVCIFTRPCVDYKFSMLDHISGTGCGSILPKYSQKMWGMWWLCK